MVFLNKNQIILILISFLLIQIKTSYIILPFTKQEQSSEPNDSNLTPEDFVRIYIEPKFSSIIEIGTPPQKVELMYSSDNYGLKMIEDKNSTIQYSFNKNLSSSINVTHLYDSKYTYAPDRPIILQEKIFFIFKDTNSNKISNIQIEDFPFVYLTKKEGRDDYEKKEFVKDENGKSYLIYGSKVYCSWKNEICESFPHYFKHNDIINSYVFNVIFNKKERSNVNKDDDYDFAFLIGSEPHKLYPDIYDKDNLKYTKALSYIGEINWIIQFDSVYYFQEGFNPEKKINVNTDDLNQISFNESLNDKKIYSAEDRGQMAFDIDIILCPKFYYFSINKTYFGNHTNQCKIVRPNNKYSLFVCEKDFNTEDFPSIYFYHKELNNTFILTQKELFKVIGDKKYFLVVYDLFRPSFWMFGKLFLQKYSFNYDIENKQLGFYKKSYNLKQANTQIESKEQNILLINLIWVGVAIIVGVGAFFLGKILFNKIRKKRANELDDDYDYEINGENNEKDKNDQYNNMNNNKGSKLNSLIY